MSSTIEQLRSRVRGEVIEPADEGYDQHRKVRNAMHDRRPAAIVRCVDAADVIAALEHAQSEAIEVAVRGGGHSVPWLRHLGRCGRDRPLADAGVRVDPTDRTARVGGGATWGDFDHATHAFGLATTGGIISTTGVGGLTLGGGIGYLARAHGLSCDNLICADVDHRRRPSGHGQRLPA